MCGGEKLVAVRFRRSILFLVKPLLVENCPMKVYSVAVLVIRLIVVTLHKRIRDPVLIVLIHVV